MPTGPANDEGLYASLVDLETLLGQSFVAAFVGGIESEERPAYLRSLLSDATSEINYAIQKGGYDAPLTVANLDARFSRDTLQSLARHCVALAGQSLAASATELPGGLKGLLSITRKWLDEVAARKTDILGATRSAANVAGQAEGMIVAAENGPTFPLNFRDSFFRGGF